MTLATLTYALRAERLKLRRTLALWLVLIAPLVTVVLRLIEWSQRGETYLFLGVNPWDRWAQSVIAIWCMLMLPLFIILETALLAGLEHSENQWKHLFALPIPRWAIYGAKVAVGTLLIGGGSVVLTLGMIGAGLALQVLKPELGFGESVIPLATITLHVFFTFMASWLLVAIHTWISTRWRSFTLAIGVGVAFTFFGLIISSTALGWIYPWSLPVNIIFGQGERIPVALVIGISGGLIGAVLGNWDVTRRDAL